MLVSARRFPGKSLWMNASSLTQRLEYWRDEIVDRLGEYSGSGYSLPARVKMQERLVAVNSALEKLNEAEEILFNMP